MPVVNPLPIIICIQGLDFGDPRTRRRAAHFAVGKQELPGYLNCYHRPLECSPLLLLGVVVNLKKLSVKLAFFFFVMDIYYT